MEEQLKARGLMELGHATCQYTVIYISTAYDNTVGNQFGFNGGKMRDTEHIFTGKLIFLRSEYIFLNENSLFGTKTVFGSDFKVVNTSHHLTQHGRTQLVWNHKTKLFANGIAFSKGNEMGWRKGVRLT